MKFGTSYSYWGNVWSCNYEKVIHKVADIGFDMLEVGADHLYHMDRAELAAMGQCAAERGIELVANCGPAKEYDLAAEEEAVRQNGTRYFKRIMENMTEIGSKKLIGAIYSFWPCDFQKADKAGAWARSIESLKEVAKTAEELDVYISLEVLNRYETFILTDCAEAREYCRQIGSSHVNILLDTFHMNIEEDDMCAALAACGELLGHVHVGEANRKLPGMNNTIDWRGVGAALRKIGYDQGVVMEPFMISGGEVGRDIKVWRDLSAGANEQQLTAYITESLQFLRKHFS